MSRSSQTYINGQQEADRFALENPIPDNAVLYRRRRAERYPDIAPNELPQEARASKDVYKQRQRENDRARANYDRAEKKERALIADYGLDERQYYAAHSAGLLPSGHRTLYPLAGTVANAELRSVGSTYVAASTNKMSDKLEHERAPRESIPIWTQV